MRGRSRRRVCRFCADSDVKIDYKNQRMLQDFISERSKIVPRRITGVCHSHQRDLTTAIKRARQIAIISYTMAI